MTDWADVLRDSLADARVSRAERKALRALVEAELPRPADRARIRAAAFDLAREEMSVSQPAAVLAWLEGVVAALAAPLPADPERRPSTTEAWFSPGTDPLRGIVGEIRSVRRRLDICVFTITDDRIVRVIEEAVGRRVRVRIVSDAEKSRDLGSDLPALARAGAEVRLDRSPDHMHHKFALFDASRLLTGSYNWTRSAERGNSENVLVTNDDSLVAAYTSEFERVWKNAAAYEG